MAMSWETVRRLNDKALRAWQLTELMLAFKRGGSTESGDLFVMASIQQEIDELQEEMKALVRVLQKEEGRRREP